MPKKRPHNMLLTGIILFTFFILFKTGYSQTCASCPNEACPIECGETLIDRSTNTEEYFYFNLTSSEDVWIVMTPSSDVNYDLYVKWSGDPCPTWLSFSCRPYLDVGVPEMCSKSDLSPGTYYLMVKYREPGSGVYNLSLSCGFPTTTTTTTTTSSTTTTETTSTTTTTTTSSTTTTETTSTSTTTTTIPIVSLQCEKDEIFVKQKNKCNATDCESGYWLIENLENSPLVNETIQDIPPNEIEFGPAKEEGKVLTTVVCTSPSLTVNHTTLVKKGPVLICPQTCYLTESCKCEIYECNNGLFLMDNYKGNPLTGDVIRDVNETLFIHNFRPIDVGKIRVRMLCHAPYETEEEAYINITYPVTTTTLPGEFDISKKTCTKDEFEVSVGKNTRTEDTILYIQIVKEPEGIIYYTGTFDIRSGFEGDKTLSLTQIKDCPGGTDLKLLVLAYSSALQRVDRLKDVAFKC